MRLALFILLFPLWCSAQFFGDGIVAASSVAKTEAVAFAPDQVSGIIGWYKGDTITGSDLAVKTSLADASGLGHTLSTGNYVLRTAYQNSKNVAWFNGTTNRIYLTPLTSTYSPPFTIFIVTKLAASASGPVVHLGTLVPMNM
jgi:hypothetical protein